MNPLRRVCVATLALVAVSFAVLPVRAEEEGPPLDRPGYWLIKAEGLARQVQHSEGRAASLVSIGTGWVEAGANVRARPLLAEAVAYGRQCRGCISKARRLSDIASLQHRAGDEAGAKATFEYAREACGALDGGRRVQAQAYLAQQLQAAGDVKGARSLFAKATKAAGMSSGFERVEALAAIADAEVSSGNREEAARIRDLLARAVAGIGADAAPALGGARLDAAMADVAAGRLGDAAKMLETVGDPDLVLSGRLSLARAAHEAADESLVSRSLVRAWKDLHEIEDPEERSYWGSEVARIARAVGDEKTQRLAIDLLEAEIAKIDPVISRFAAVVTWLDALRAAGEEKRLATGLVALEAIEARYGKEVETRDRMRALRAGVLSRAGRFAEAGEVVAAIEEPVRRVSARLDVADQALRSGKTSAALEAATRVGAEAAAWGEEREGERDEVLRRVAVLKAACGAHAEAEGTVDVIHAPFHAVAACTYIARDLE